MATLRVTGCSVDTKSIRISFSDKVDQTVALNNATSAINTSNYTIFAPNSGLNPAQTPTSWPISMEDDRTVAISTPSTISFSPGDWVLVTVSNIGLQANPGVSAMANPESVSRQVPSDAKRVTRDVEDAISYPILTEEISGRPSPVGIPATGGTSGGGSNLGQVAMKAVTDVLGWKVNSADPKGFIGALTQSFTLQDVEGHVESTWTPRTYAVQTDLGGGITGAQASLYTRAKDALDSALPLLDGLYPLDPEADPEYVRSLREMARSQMTEIVRELGVVGLPSILRIDTYFGILLGQNPAELNSTPVIFDPDAVDGTLGQLRDTYGIYFSGNPYNNSVLDEQDITNFRMISDYMTSLMQSWVANRQFFVVSAKMPAFFGTQLVLISRQFNVIAETVNEVRFALDSVFIGPNERQTLLLEFNDPNLLPSMFLEDIFEEVENFATNEGPRLLRDGGKISVTNNILPVVRSLRRLIRQAHEPRNIGQLPDGFRTARVRHALDDLKDQLDALIHLTEQVEQQAPSPVNKLAITDIVVATQSVDLVRLSLLGEGIDSSIDVVFHSTTATTAGLTREFFSAQRLDVSFAPQDFPGTHDITLTNPSGESVNLVGAFTIDQNYHATATQLSAVSSARRTTAATSKALTPMTKRRAVVVSAGGSGNPAAAAPPPIPAPAMPPTLASLQKKQDEIQKKLDTIQHNHDALSQKLDDAQKRNQQILSTKFAEVQKSNETLLQKLDGIANKVLGASEGKGKKGKD